MLSIILTILKIIGIILLVIIGLLLMLTLTVLFVPIKYQSEGDFKKLDDSFKDNVSVRVTWILRILSVSFKLTDTKPELVIKVFGKKLSLDKKNDDESPKKSKKKRDKSKKVAKDEPKTKNEEDRITEEDISNITEKSYDITANQTDDNKKSIKEKLFSIWNKIDTICQKIKKVKDIKDSFVEYLKREESKLAIRELKSIILKALKKLLPKKLKAKVKFGFEDPSTTGNVLGILSILYGIYADKLELEPDFENAHLEGEYALEGKIRLITIVTTALKIYRNQWLKRFIAFSKKTINKI